MKKVFYIETTTDKKTLLYCSNGDGTNDVEVIELPEIVKEKKCDCKWSLQLVNGFCQKCEKRINKVILRK